MEVRLIIEPEIAALAAMRASRADIEALERYLQQGEQAADTPSFEHWDGALHRGLALASRNTFLLAIFDAINDVRRSELWGRLKEQSVTRERRRHYADQHRALVALVRDRDSPGAKRTMREHLAQVRSDLLSIGSGDGPG
jgi:DNA-binding FadR family transcriptional regulator